jgi:hypothetical protein
MLRYVPDAGAPAFFNDPSSIPKVLVALWLILAQRRDRPNLSLTSLYPSLEKTETKLRLMQALSKRKASRFFWIRTSRPSCGVLIST